MIKVFQEATMVIVLLLLIFFIVTEFFNWMESFEEKENDSDDNAN